MSLAGLYFDQGLQVDRSQRAVAGSLVGTARSSRQRRMARRHAGGLPRARHRQSRPTRARPFGCSRPTCGGDVTVRPQRWLLLTAGACVRRLHAEGPDRRSHLGRGRLHPETAPGVGANPSYLHTTTVRGDRLAAGRRLRAARRPLPGRAPSLRRSRRHLQLRPARRRGRAAHSDPARELGDLAARPAGDDAR